MNIHYLGNSGFALEQNGELLVIDCYNPGEHALLKEDSLQRFSKTTVLVSHRHSDHYAKAMLELPGAQCAVGFDVRAKESVPLLHPGDSIELNGMRLTAYGSTDEGVSFHILWGELSIFHAGDLNDWHWRDEGGEVFAREAEKRFLVELGRVAAGIGTVDIAFFPVDPRMGSDYYRGAVLFAQSVRPKRFIPMHFGTSFSPPPGFFEEMAAYTEVDASPLG